MSIFKKEKATLSLLFSNSSLMVSIVLGRNHFLRQRTRVNAKGL